MNLFQKYGIKEVLDVVFYSITKVGDEIIYTPVLVLDTLKVSTIEKKAEKVSAQGGLGNKKLINWNFGKEISLQLSDALFSPASMSLIWGGKFDIKLSHYTSAIVKSNIANKYGSFNYSIKAYPSPVFTNEEWEIIYKAATELKIPGPRIDDEDDKKYQDIYWVANYTKDLPVIEENRIWLKKNYIKRLWYSEYKQELIEIMPVGTTEEQLKLCAAMPEVIINKIIDYIDELRKIGYADTEIYDIEVLDRWEKCIVTDREGLVISTREQKENLLRYYRNDKSSSYAIYYDAKTMLPLLNITEDGLIKGWEWNDEQKYDKDFDGKPDEDKFKIKIGTTYYKWTRTVKYKDGVDDGVLGKTFVIDADTFPGQYKIMGETYIREQKTQKDRRCQIVIHQATIGSDTNITLQADGDPTTFDMQIDVLVPKNNIPMEIKTFDVDEDKVRGGTRVVPQRSRQVSTPTEIVEEKYAGFENPEMY